MSTRRISYPLIGLAIALVWGVIETLALWRVRRSGRTVSRLTQA
jgi:hypothetical protein